MKYFITKPYILAIAGLFAITSCSDSKDEIDDQFAQTAHIVKGKVEKGRHVSGSPVEMRTWDKDMTPKVRHIPQPLRIIQVTSTMVLSR
jgi:hypothetical protein